MLSRKSPTTRSTSLNCQSRSGPRMDPQCLDMLRKSQQFTDDLDVVPLQTRGTAIQDYKEFLSKMTEAGSFGPISKCDAGFAALFDS